MQTTDQLIQLAKASMTPNYAPPPFVAARGAGVHLWDTDGKQYLDFAGGMGVNALGHAHPHVTKAIATQAQNLCHTSNAFYHAQHIALCVKLCEISFAEQVYLCNSGAEAVEAALKVARRHFFDQGAPRQEFVAAHNSFHGRTWGALSVTGQEAYRKGFAPLVETVRFVPFNDLSALASVVHERTAAVIVEPIQGNGGVLVPDAAYLQGVKALCAQHGALLIVDEVQTGIGRTGRWFAYEHDGMLPDIMCLAKALGGGLPLGAMITTKALAACLQPGVHATTFGGNAVACAAGLATLQVIESEDLLQRCTTLGHTYRQMLQTLSRKHAQVEEIRGRGLLVGLKCDTPVKALQVACREGGMLSTAAGSHVLRLFPPLNSHQDDLQRSVDILDKALSAMAR